MLYLRFLGEATIERTWSFSSCTFLFVGLRMAILFKLSMLVLSMMLPKVALTKESG